MFLDDSHVLYNYQLKTFKDNRLKTNADFTGQKISAHAEAMMKRFMVMVVHLQE